MKTIRLAEVQRSALDIDGARDAAKQLVIGSDDGSPSFSMRVFTIAPGGHTPYHGHPFEHLNYVISGTGALVDAQGQEHPIRAGDFALVLPGETHQYRNTATEGNLVIICAVPRQYE